MSRRRTVNYPAEGLSAARPQKVMSISPGADYCCFRYTARATCFGPGFSYYVRQCVFYAAFGK